MFWLSSGREEGRKEEEHKRIQWWCESSRDMIQSMFALFCFFLSFFVVIFWNFCCLLCCLYESLCKNLNTEKEAKNNGQHKTAKKNRKPTQRQQKDNKKIKQRNGYVCPSANLLKGSDSMSWNTCFFAWSKECKSTVPIRMLSDIFFFTAPGTFTSFSAFSTCAVTYEYEWQPVCGNERTSSDQSYVVCWLDRNVGTQEQNKTIENDKLKKKSNQLKTCKKNPKLQTVQCLPFRYVS